MTGIIDNGTIGSAVLVLGADGDVGLGVARAALEAGRAVIAVAKDPGALGALAAQHPGAALRTLEASIASDGDAAELAARLRALDIGFDGVIASIAGEHVCGRLIDQPADVLRRTLDQDLMPHLFAARHLFPLLPQDGRHGYVLVGGPGGDYPWAGYGHCSIAAAALRMMARVLHDEAARHGLRVQLLSLDAPVGTDANATYAGSAWPKAVVVGRRALSLLAGATSPAPAVVGVSPSPRASAPHPARRDRPHAPDHVPARELRDARALLSSLSTLPPTSPGILHDEAF
jgi:NAD(P)-dependent dehydrogenase (short-subunit alcohol dehydrogenase family)